MIRVAEEADWPAVLEVHRLAFGEEDVPRLVTEIREARLEVPSLSFVAVADGRVVGNVLNSWVGIEGSEARLLQLSPLGVHPDFQRQGHGAALVRASLEGVRALGEPLLLVEGNPRYYGRFGFVRADELGVDRVVVGRDVGEQLVEQVLMLLTCLERRHLPSVLSPS